MARRPTILDVAKAAGVSKSTVSLVVRGSETVKDSTREIVREAMRDLGYVYNRSAATLRSASSGLIGLVINDLRNPFFTEFAASLQMYLAEQGYATVIANTDEDPELQNRTIASLCEHGLSGLILSPAYGQEDAIAAELHKAAVPTIQVFRRLEVLGSRVPFIAPDYETGSALATRHLMDQGCKRIAFLGGLPERPVTRERMSAYLSALKDENIEPLVLTGETSRSFGRSMAPKLRQTYSDVDGVLCFNDLVALGLLAGCSEHGPRVGKDLRVIGIDDIEDCQDSHPPLSSVSCDIPNLAHTAAHHLLEWIQEGRRPDAVLRTPVSLVCRTSSTGR
ncbi:LacI family DNA-binding transcriptional regulator [Marivita geojedonensis]|uniref:LacI family transcriptional regulator n=1 Tax=Marivita geojedonensis TaxID=1123756 RepID=A0A1X4NQ38_9RHOB|nr:LacI family DNA-binding transcriptional regulator [Marivita geojedonensis]OSQ53074.1 LacI family transcriptional regulator [Marivita geojedonensis]PRY82009.1 LacI family transcriptional regulator [Marivita geojedonensis]